MKKYTLSAYSTAAKQLSTECQRSALICSNCKLLSLVLIVLMLVMVNGGAWGQTVLIDPTGNGGFETGISFMANGWTAVNGVNNQFYVGNIPVASDGTNCAFTSGSSSTWVGTNNQNVNHFYKDINFNSEKILNISFKYKINNPDATYDYLRVFLVSTGTTPVAGTQLSGQLGSYDATTTWTTVNLNGIDASNLGTSARLVFSWRTDGQAPPAAVAVDYISLTSSVQTTFNVSGTFTAPAGVRKVTVEAWGGGGAGGGLTTNYTTNGGGGGAGGQYARKLIDVTPTQGYSIVVGAGGTGGEGNGTAGGNSTFNSTTVVAIGGAGGAANNGAGGIGSTTDGVGDFVYRGGTGTSGSGRGGAGGGGAGSTGNGGDASGTTAGNGTSEYGGTGGVGRTNEGDGNSPSLYGGGGGGARGISYWTTNYSGASGAKGRVEISWTCPSIALTSGSSTPTVCVNTPITNIVYTIGDNYVVANVTGLPTGVTHTIVGNTLTISGTPSVTTGSPFNYSITLTKPTGCSTDAVASGTITVNPLPTFTTAYTDITCFGAGNGTITVNNVTGGTSPYSFSIDNGTNFQSGNAFNSLLPAIYKIRVRDTNGCVSPLCP